MAASSSSQSEAKLCPRHIETPIFPAIAKIAQISAKVEVGLTIGDDGKVIDAKVLNESDKGVYLLDRSVLENARLWTFSPPQSPHTQTLEYDFSFDEKLPEGSATTVSYDLPDRVVLRGGPAIIMTTTSRSRTK